MLNAMKSKEPKEFPLPNGGFKAFLSMDLSTKERFPIEHICQLVGSTTS